MHHARPHLPFPKIGTQTLFLSAVPLGFLVLLLALALVLQSRNALIAEDSQRSAQVLSQSDHAMQLLDDAGRSIVAYERSRKETTLAPYRTAVRELPGVLDGLAATVRDDPQVRVRSARVVGDLTRGMVILKEYLAHVQAHDMVAAKRLAESPRVRRLSFAISTHRAPLNNSERISTAAHLRKMRKQIEGFTVALVSVCLLGIALTIAVCIRFSLGITRRVVRLADNARRLAQGEKTEPISGDDEISQLDRVYQEMMRRIQREHDMALLLQRALLPQQLPALPGVRLDTAYTPAADGTEIGGDWYDVFRISDRRIGISIGDVAGHGLRAAAIMGNARQAIRTVAYVEDDPATVVGHVNRVLCRNEGGVLLTAFFATFDLLDGVMRYCLAGHPPPMVVTSGGLVQNLPGKGFVLGVDPLAAFETEEVKLDVGSAIVLYTDGLIEASRDYFKGVQNLQAAIEKEYLNESGNIAEAIQRRVFAQHPPRDDSALLFMGITALGTSALEPERLTWRADARVAPG